MNIASPFFVLLACALFAPAVLAQDNYLPPPLFAEPREPPPRPKIPETKMPRVSKTIEDYIEPKKEDKLIVKPRKVPAKAPTPPKEKPVVSPSKKNNKIEITKESPAPSVPKSQPIKEKPLVKAPTPRKTNTNGVVKGPKVMPAVKKKNVDAEVTFENTEASSINMIERVQAKAPKEAIENADENTETSRLKTPIETDVQMIDSLMLGYEDGVSELSAENKIKLFSKIVPVLKANDRLKISIEAYASPQKDQMNGDRRLALSRAMAIRSYLIDQDTEPQRINVRSLGSQSNISPLDRVEITLAP